MPDTLFDLRFLSKVNKDGPIPKIHPELGPCWLWTGGVTGTPNSRYGGFWHKGKCIAAHRYSYMRWQGAIPTGMTIDHLCEVKICVNPVHLEAVTLAENILRAALNHPAKECLILVANCSMIVAPNFPKKLAPRETGPGALTLGLFSPLGRGIENLPAVTNQKLENLSTLY